MSRRRPSRIDLLRSNWRRLWGEPIGWVWLSAFLLHIVALLWVQNLVMFEAHSSDEHGIFIVRSMRFREEEKKEPIPIPAPREVEVRTEVIPLAQKNQKPTAEKKAPDPSDVPNWNPLTQVGAPTPVEEKTVKVAPSALPGVKIWDIQAPVKKVVFLIDVSGTMWNEIDGRWGFQIAQDEVARSISAMPPEMSFNIVYYSDETSSMASALVPATHEYKELARRFLALKPNLSGATDFFKGLQGAFEQGPEAVFIFTDGEMDVPRWKVPSRFDALREKTGPSIHLFGVGFFYEKNQECLDLLQKICFLSGGDFKLYNRYTPPVKVEKKK
ncbi:MAG: VWA domain-containing protein [Verrucomicrobiota bacterium]